MTAKPQEDLQKVHKRRKNRESFLETLESIVVAFVLAFVFRAFIVEAFVIPTGSMGPTLYGAHLEFKCSDCGYEFAMGYEEPGGDARSRSAVISEPVCPNCFRVQQPPARIPVYSGDRILVLKFLYDFEEPQRWDVIVFRNPNEPSQNYIKRLVALPGETMELVHGDVTIDGHIAHKTDRAQDALWMLIHDTRYRPTRRDWVPRWVAQEAWQPHQEGFVLEKAPDRDKTAWLAYRHRDPSGRLENILDFYAYNSGADVRRFAAAVCTDLGLKTEVTAAKPSSEVVIEMRAYKDLFRFELTAEGGSQPTRILVNNQVVAESKGGVLPVGRPTSVQVANVDRKVMLLVGGRRVAKSLAPEATPEGDPLYESKPVPAEERRRFENPTGDDPRNMAADVRIGGRGGPVTLAYLRLDRDVYYLNERIHGLDGSPTPGHGTEGSPFALEAREFFVCGDNSPKSFDCRLWPLPRPVVPRRNLVGKAFFVYWPSAGARHGVPIMPDPMGFRMVH